MVVVEQGELYAKDEEQPHRGLIVVGECCQILENGLLVAGGGSDKGIWGQID